MKRGAALIGVLCLGLPLWCQQSSGDQGVVNQDAIRSAIAKALEQGLKLPIGTTQPFPKMPTRINLLRNPPIRPSVACAIPLREMAADQDTDRGMALKNRASEGDSHMVLAPRAPSCAESQ